MGAFVKERVPGWEEYADREALTLEGRGQWRSTRCAFHGDKTPSMRVNTETGSWVCMACQEKGGDTLSHFMRSTGFDFVTAAKILGAWDDSREWSTTRAKPAPMPARDAMQLIAHALRVLVGVIADARRGVLPSDADWSAFLERAGQIEWLASEYPV